MNNTQFVEQPQKSIIHTHTEKIVTEQSVFPSNPNLNQAKPVGNSIDNKLQGNLVSSELGSNSSGNQSFFIGQDFYNPQIGLKGLKISPTRRAMLDQIDNKKWKLHKVSKNDLNDRSAPNFAVRENDVLPVHTAAEKQLLQQIDNKKFKLEKVKKAEIDDRSAPNLHLRSEVMPEMTQQRKLLLADIDGKKWKKLAGVPKDRLHDRSAANLALWPLEKSAIKPEYEKKYPVDKNAYQNDFYRPVSTSVEKAPVSNSTVSTGVVDQQPLHLHSDMNASFPVSEGHAVRHQDVPAHWQGNTVGEKMSSLGKGFAGWVKEEVSEVKDAFTGLGKKKNTDSANLHGNSYVAPNTNTTAVYPTGTAPVQSAYGVNNVAVPADLVAPGSSVQSGLKSQTVVDNRNLNDQTVIRSTDKTIY